MTDNQEKELFNILNTLVTEVKGIKLDVGTLKSDVGTLKSDVKNIQEVQQEHSKILIRLEAKTDMIAEKVINHEKRLTVVEKDVADLRGGVH